MVIGRGAGVPSPGNPLHVKLVCRDSYDRRPLGDAGYCRGERRGSRLPRGVEPVQAAGLDQGQRPEGGGQLCSGAGPAGHYAISPAANEQERSAADYESELPAVQVRGGR